MKWLKAALAILLACFIPIAAVIGVIASESGTRWLFNHVPKLTLTTLSGTLLSEITLTGLHYESPDLSLSADTVHLAWRANELLSRTLAIDALTTQKLTITSHPTKPSQPSTFDWQQGIRLPVSIQLKHVQLDDTELISKGSVVKLDKILLALESQETQVMLQQLTVDLPGTHANATGTVNLSAGFPMQLQGDWRYIHAVGTWQGQLQITGDINQLMLQHELKQPFALQSKAELSQLLTTPTIQSVNTWQQLRWPLTGATPQLQSQQGQLEINGTLNAYQVNASAQLASLNVKHALLSLQGQGSLTNFSFKPLQLTTADGQCQITGEVSWQNFLAFNIGLNAKAFNLALFAADFPSQLNLSSQLRGQYQKDWQASLQINKIDGTLRGQPITAQGLVEYQQDQLTIKPLTVKIGRNQLKSQGVLSLKQADLTVNADMPELSALWPGLAGKINGQTTLKGHWPVPNVNAQLSAQDLHFQQHSAKTLALFVDVKPEDPNSHIEFKADVVQSNALTLSKAHIDISGDINKQHAQSQIDSNYGQLSLALSGQWHKPIWSGQLTELSLTTTGAGDWQLTQAPVMLKVQALAKALSVELAPLCLSQMSARVCVAGQYTDAQRIMASFTSQGLPLALLNPIVPNHAVTFNNTVLNSDVQLKSDAKNSWSGHYQLTAPSSTLTVNGAKQPATLALGELAVKGVLAAQQLKTELAFSYEGNNQITGAVNLGLVAPQALSGQVNAKLSSYQLLNAFLPEASITSGVLNADITLAGQLAKPKLTGQLTWHDGMVTSTHIGLTDIQIDATAEQSQHIKLNATAKPFLPSASGLDKTFSLQSELQLSADMTQQKNGLSGEFHFNTSDKTIVQVKQRRQVHTIELTRSTLNAGLDGEQLTGQMTLGLTGNDKGLAQFQYATASQKLQGHLGLQMTDTAWLDPFLPDLSQLKGRVQADLNVAGQLNAPLLTGQVVVDEAGAKINPLGIVLQNVKLSASADGTESERLQIQGSASSGKGDVQLAGNVLMKPLAGWPIELTITGKEFEVARLPEAEVNISPDLTFSQANQQATLNGTLKIPYAKLAIKEVPKSAIVVSQDEVILNQPKPEEAKSVKTYGINSTINVELGEQVSFTGQGLKTQLTGALKVVSVQDTLKVHGDVNMVKASYESYGQNLAVRKGRLIFNGPVDNPWLDVEASRLSQDKKVTAVVSVSGPLKAPQTRISSEPALAESDALAYLLTGKPLTQVSQSESNMVASAALAYGSGQMGWVAEQLGIDELSVQQGSTLKDTLLTVGQYLTPDFYVGTKVGLFNKQAVLVLKHKLTDTVNVETQTGTSQRIKLNYEQDKD